jgi:hypothetical protein
MLTGSPTANESQAAVFAEYEFVLTQQAVRAPKQFDRSLQLGPSQLFLKDNLLMTEDGRPRLRTHSQHLDDETARYCNESSEDAGVVDQVFEEFSMAINLPDLIL